MEIPDHKVTAYERHEWVIGIESRHTTARDLADGIRFAERDMEELGVKMTSDDAYHVRAGEGGEVVLYVEVKVEVAANSRRPRINNAS